MSSLEVSLLILLGAVLHALWNIAIRSSGLALRPLWISLASGSLLGTAVGWLTGQGLPPIAHWAAICSATVHALYFYLITIAYKKHEASLVYPLSRAVALLICTIAGASMFNESVTSTHIVGITLVIVGIFRLWSRRDVATTSTLYISFGMILGALVALASVIDTLGVRSAHVVPYTAAIFTDATIVLFPMVLLLENRAGSIEPWPLKAGFLGCLMYTAYLCILGALAETELHYVAATREVSIVVVVLVGVIWLKESLDCAKVIGLTFLLTGVVFIHF